MKRLLGAGVSLMLVVGPIHAEPARTDTYKPAFVPPGELVQMMGARDAGAGEVLTWADGGAEHRVTIRRNDAANLILFTGDAADVAAAGAMAKAFDVAPRQIALEARIVEVDTDRARDLGIDWSRIRLDAGLNQRIDRNSTDRFLKNRNFGSTFDQKTYDRATSTSISQQASLTLANALGLLEQEGGATFHDAPRVLTLNNRAATVFDGTHVTYVNRAASYANIYQTEAMDAGLKLDVMPSLGDGGYLRLQLHAELTAMVDPTWNQFNQTGSGPAKQGQSVDDVVVAKDGETVLLGGFTRTAETRSRRRFPVLGAALPFLFSRHAGEAHHHTTLIAITAHVVDLAAGADEPTRRMLEAH